MDMIAKRVLKQPMGKPNDCDNQKNRVINS